MEDQLQSEGASPGSFGTSLTARYVERSRRDRTREEKRAIVLLLALQVLLWAWFWAYGDSPRERILDMLVVSGPAVALLVALGARAPRATMIVVAAIAWAFCVLIVGLAI